MIGRRKGYRVAVVMPDNVTLERRQLIALHGAEVIDSPGALGSNGAIAVARDLVARDPRFVMADQYANPANPRVHEETTGPEILDAVPELDVFVAGLGTGGTLTGVGRFLRRAKPGVQIIAAEPLPGEAGQGGNLRGTVLRRDPVGGRARRPVDGSRHDRRAAPRRRLEVPLGGHLLDAAG
jgi:cysteine synthase B